MAKLRMARKLQDTRTAKIGEFCGSQGFFWFHLLPSISIHFSSSFVRSFQVLTGPLASCQRWHHCHHLQLPSTVAVWLCVSMQWLDTNSSDRMKWTCDEWNHDAIPLRNKEQRIATWIYPGNRQAGAQPIDALFWTDRCAAEPTEGWVRWAWDTRCQRYTSRFVHRMHWPRARCDLSAFISAPTVGASMSFWALIYVNIVNDDPIWTHGRSNDHHTQISQWYSTDDPMIIQQTARHCIIARIIRLSNGSPMLIPWLY
jgi:hypothetical protein